MRIGISCYATLGGSGALATELGKALAARGHEVHFIVFGMPFRLGMCQENIYVHEVETANYPVLQSAPFDLALAAKMADVIRNYDLDILHVHYAVPFAVCAFLAREMVGEHDVGVITTLHGTDVTVLAQDPLLRDAIRLGIEKSDLVTAVSQSLIEQTRELFQPRCPIAKVYNFVDTELFARVPDTHWRQHLAPNGEKILLHMSNFRTVKRIPDVLAIFSRVREQMPVKLVMVGEGPELDAARRQAYRENIARDVHFLGQRDEVAPLLSVADVLLLPSEKESFGLVALEAMACGVPVIASRAGGIPEVVEHGENGFLSEVGNVDEMAFGTMELLRSPELWNRFSQSARRRACEFGSEQQVSEYESLYERILACKTGA